MLESDMLYEKNAKTPSTASITSQLCVFHCLVSKISVTLKKLWIFLKQNKHQGYNFVFFVIC